MSEATEPAGKRLRANLLEAMVEASLSGHELSLWEPIDRPQTYSAACVRCGQQIRVSPRQIDSDLGSACRVRDVPDRILSELRAAAHTGDEDRFHDAYLTLLAHFADYTLVQLQSDAELEAAAWRLLPAAFQQSVQVLRRLLDQKLDEE